MRPEGAETLRMTYEGQTLNGRYLLERVISRGGMGTVYQGVHTLIGRKVAVKILNSDLSFREDIVTRFYREAQAAAVIGHRNIVDVLDVGIVNDSQPYLVMEYLEGESLLEMMGREGTLNLAAACGVMEPVLQALSASHEKGVVHRDLKPDNIFIGMEAQNDLVVKVIDFGISKFAHTLRDQRLTLAGSAVGTPPYMSPEQARGDVDVDLRADIYSLGVIFYEMLTGGLPFSGVTVREVLSKVIHDPPTPPEEINSLFPTAAGPLLEKALAKDPNDRYAGAEEMLADIRQLDAYRDRHLSLAAAAAGIVNVSCAGVDTSSDRHPVFPSSVAPDPLSLFATQDAGSPSSVAPPLRRPEGGGGKKAMIGLAAAALVLLGMVIVFVFNRNISSTETDLSINTKSAGFDTLRPTKADEKQDWITISVTGISDDARIYYDGTQMLSRSFRIPSDNAAKSLRVEREGFIPYEVLLVPEKDVVLDVRLKSIDAPTEIQGKNTSKGKGTHSPRRIENSAESEVDKVKKAGFKKGRHGATIADDFE